MGSSDADSFDPQFWYSIGILLMTWTLSEILLTIVFKVWPDPKIRIRVYLAEIVETFERIATCFELGIIMGGYGVLWYALIFFVALMWYTLHWGPNKSSVSYHWSNFEAKRSGLLEIFIHVGIEICAGLLVYPLYIKPLWSFCEHHPLRGAKLHNEWKSGVQIDPWLAGLSEFGFSLLCEFGVKVLFAWFRGNMLNKVLTAMLIDYTAILGLKHAGGYYDPTLATITQFGVKGSSIIEHFLVYWVASIVGTILGGITFTYTKRYITPADKVD